MAENSRTALRAASFAMLMSAAFAVFAAATPPVHYTLDPTRSLLRFTFMQAGASNTGRFNKFTADVLFSNDNLAASKIDVTVDINSLDTGDMERDDTLRSPDLFDVKKYPQARFVATRFTSTGAGRYDALGKLTIRNVTKDLKLPITFQTKTEQGQNIGYLTGRVTIRRLDFGVGQGEWKATDQVPDDVQVSFSLRLAPKT
ncbi:MAG TPA: YceI family protein [Steroidobacteraceae bacterium]|nr:YceI family protein [Steroidobacteraceae bacterium]